MSVPDHVKVAVLGSGTGTNARSLIEYGMQPDCPYGVDLVVSTRPDAGIVDVARETGVPCIILPPSEWESNLGQSLEYHGIEILALAGFLRKLPESIIAQLGGRVVNTHPALLPNFGGKGMYGIHVHRAVIESGVSESGATVHVVTDEYDDGAIIAQISTPVVAGESAEELQERIKKLEHGLYPRALAEFARWHRAARENDA